MPDRIAAAVRSRVMASVKKQGTRLEKLCSRRLREAGWSRVERQVAALVGTPDFVLRRQRVALFVDSCFWHGCRRHLRMPRSNADYWSSKIERNRARDRAVSAALRRAGWRVVRVWEHDVRDEAAWAVRLNAIRRVARGTRTR